VKREAEGLMIANGITIETMVALFRVGWPPRRRSASARAAR
jgi:hypothetical protein